MSSYKIHGQQRFKPSFLRRQGKMTKAQKRYYREHWTVFGLELRYKSQFSAEEYFGNQNPVCLEIGFGQAETLLYQAMQDPQRNFIGIEVHKPAIASCLGKLAELGLENVLLLKRDAFLILLDHLKDTKLEEVWVFFPKPWEEEDRRVLRSFFLEVLEPHLKLGAKLYCATDVLAYAAFAIEAFEENPRWKNMAEKGMYTSRPVWRQCSKYEQKGIEEGRENVDFCFQYVGGTSD